MPGGRSAVWPPVRGLVRHAPLLQHRVLLSFAQLMGQGRSSQNPEAPEPAPKRFETLGPAPDTASEVAQVSSPPTPLRTGQKQPRAVVRTLEVKFATDAALAAALCQGHPAAAAAAWDRFAPLVRGLLRKTMGPTCDVDDAVQDVFMTLLRRVRDLRDPSALGSFVVGITVRTARTILRKRRILRWIPFSADDPTCDVALPNVDFASREALRRLYAILDGLDAE